MSAKSGSYLAQKETLLRRISQYVQDSSLQSKESFSVFKLICKAGYEVFGVYPQYMDLARATHAIDDGAIMPDYWMVRMVKKGLEKQDRPLYIDSENRLICKKPEHCHGSAQMPYGLAFIPDGATAYLVEGFKCVEAAMSCGIYALTSGGSSSYAMADWSLLHQKQIKLIGFADNDEAGRKYIAQVSARYPLSGAVDSSSLGEKGDVADWVHHFMEQKVFAPTLSDLQQAFPVLPYENLPLDEAVGGGWLPLDQLHSIEGVGIGRSQIPQYQKGLPDLMSSIINAITKDIQCDALLGFSCLLGITAGTQSHLADVHRNNNSSSPISLYLVCLAVSGERKTAVEAKLNKEYLQICAQRRDTFKKEWARYEAKRKLHERAAGLLLKECTEGDGNQELYLAHMEKSETPPKNTDLHKGANATTQHLVHHFGNAYPQVFMVSSEGGVFYGSFANSGEQALATQTTWNSFWNGVSEGAFLKDKENSALRQNCRLTLSLAVQPQTFARWLYSDDGGAQAVSNGANARVLYSYPPSTIGTRREDRGHKAQSIPERECYQMLYRIHRKVMSTPAIINGDGIVPLFAMDIRDDEAAANIFYDFADEIELQMAPPSGRYFQYRDIASKTGEQALRIAANLAIFNRVHQLILEADKYSVSSVMSSLKDQIADAICEEVPLSEQELSSIVIGVAEISCAINLAQYYLDEAIRLIEGLGQQVAGEDAMMVINCLMSLSIEKGLGGVIPKREVDRQGVRWMRKASGMARIEALCKNELDGYVRVIKVSGTGKKTSFAFEVNPDCFNHPHRFGL